MESCLCATLCCCLKCICCKCLCLPFDCLCSDCTPPCTLCECLEVSGVSCGVGCSLCCCFACKEAYQSDRQRILVNSEAAENIYRVQPIRPIRPIAPIVSIGPSEDEAMTTIDFTKKWDMSDVAIKVNDVENLLYANKTVLAVHSPFFKALFFADFAESKQDVVEIDISFWTMLEILWIVHNVKRQGRCLLMRTKCFFSHNRGLLSVFSWPISPAVPSGRRLWHPRYSKSLEGTTLPNVPPGSIRCISPIGTSWRKGSSFGESKTNSIFQSEVLKKMTVEDIETYLKTGVTGMIFTPADALVIIQKCQEAEKKKTCCSRCGSTDVQGRRTYSGQIVCNRCEYQVRWIKNRIKRIFSIVYRYQCSFEVWKLIPTGAETPG